MCGTKLASHFVVAKKLSVKDMNVQYPLLMASRIDKWGWRLPYSDYFGGVGTISAKQFEQV